MARETEQRFGTKFCIECLNYQEQVGEIRDGICFGCKKRLEEYRRNYNGR
jgi:hypothetical protein